MAKLRVEISIPAERYVALYGGKTKNVVAMAEGGVRVQFPGSALHRHVTRDGVHGVFDLHFDNNNKLVSIERVIGD